LRGDDGQVTSGRPERPKSRTFTREFKAKIVAEFGALPANSPERGALLRKNRLYHSHIDDWRRQLDCCGEGNGLAAVITECA
jgi:transposase